MNFDRKDIEKTTNLLNDEKKKKDEKVEEVEINTKRRGRLNNKDFGIGFELPQMPNVSKSDQKKDSRNPRGLPDYEEFYRPPWWASILAKTQTIVFPFVSGMMTGLGMITAALIVSSAKKWFLSGWPISNLSLEAEDENYYGTGINAEEPFDTPNIATQQVWHGYPFDDVRN